MKPKWITAFGSIMVILGSALPWATVEIFLLGQQAVSGLQGDGVITLLLGIVVLILALAAQAESGKTPPIVASLLALVAGVIGLIDLTNVERASQGILGSVSIGVGLYLVVIGAFVAVVGGLSWYNASEIIAVSSSTPVAKRARQPKSITPLEPTCPTCGANITPGAMYCVCWERLPSELRTRSKDVVLSADSQPTGVPPSAIPPSAAPLVDGLCPKCGADVRSSALYCDECGQRIRRQ